MRKATTLNQFWQQLCCLLFHRWEHSDWKPTNFDDHYRVVACSICNEKWLEHK